MHATVMNKEKRREEKRREEKRREEKEEEKRREEKRREEKRRENKLFNKVVILIFFMQKKYSRCFIKLQLKHWCHMDCFNNVLSTFLRGLISSEVT